MKQADVTIIGAGPGGLASAMLLAEAGAKVHVIERETRPGGRTSTIEKDGFRFDRGPTFFLYPEVLESVFAMCGRRLEDEVDLIRLDPNYRLQFENGGDLDVSCDPDRLREAVRKISPRDADGIDAYLADNRRKFKAFRPVLEAPFESHLEWLKLLRAELIPLIRPFSGVDADLKRYFSDPRIRLAFSFQSKYLGMSPYKCPSLFTILAFLEHEFGVFHPVGGCGAVSEAMARVAEDMGVRFSYGKAVEGIEFEGRRVRGVRTADATHRTDALVINADFANAMRRLVPDRLRRRWTDAKIAKKKMSCSTFMLYLGIEGKYEDLPHHTIFLSEDYEDNLRDIEQAHRPSVNPSLYVHNPSVLDPTLAPDGMSSLYVLAPVTHQHPNVDWAAEQPAFRERMLNQLTEKLGLEGLRDRIRTEVVCTPQHWEADLDLYKGATFSLAHSLDQMLSFRPRNRFEDLDGVYLTGGGTHPGSGLPVIYQSAKISSELLVQDFGLSAGWARPDEAVRRWAPLAEQSA